MQNGESSQETSKQTLLLWAVIGAGGRVLQKDIPYDVDAGVRKALKNRNLIETSKGPRGAVVIAVTDKGWEWADRHLDALLPAKSSKKRPAVGPYVILQQWLARLAVYKQRAGVSLAELVGEAAATESATAPASAPAPVAPESLPEARRMIEAAYRTRMAREPASSCSLKDLRADLPVLDRAGFDQAVLGLVEQGHAVLLRADNNLALTADDNAAGIREGGEVRHLLWIKP